MTHSFNPIWKEFTAATKVSRHAVLLVVAESSGSSPGRAGFKMLVTEDGIFGSIGGGVMEVELVERARLQFKVQNAKCETTSGQSQIENRKSQMVSGKSQIFEMVHRKNDPNSSGMICSGKQTVIMLLLDAADVPVLEKLAESSPTAKSLRITNQGLGLRDEPIEGERRFERNGDEFIYEETIGVKPQLFIIGGGHCALALSEIASRIGFRVSLFDDRDGLNTIEKNEFADQICILESYEKIDEFLPADERAFVVVMTLGYKFDEIVVRRLIGRDFRYFGVLGSRAKIATMFAELEKSGVPRERLTKIKAPVGVPINSRTPAEIAISIAAELIAVRNAV